jgi:hypothetical protein
MKKGTTSKRAHPHPQPKPIHAAAASHAVPRPMPRALFEPHRQGRTDDADAFIPDPEGGPARTSDDLAESLAEEFLESATSGEDMAEEMQNEIVPEELGGPFVESTAEQEFAAGTDASNPEDAEQEPLPRPGAGIIGNRER